jgi:uncharacterized membrane protein (UPF0127 family)
MKIIFSIAGAWILAAFFSASQAQQTFPTTTLNVGVHLIKAEVAINEGMVFRFPETRHLCMWMKNTLLPLSVAFIDEKGRIINIEDMQPQTLNAHCAKKPARFALEMNQGWFRQKNIRAGVKVTGLPQ